MVLTFATVLMFVALILFILAAINVAVPRISLMALGLAFVAASFLVAPM